MNTLWTDKEINKLRSYIKEYPIKKIAQKLKRSERSIKRKMKELNIEDPNSSYSYWNEEDINKLKELVNKYTYKQISEMFGNRSVISIKKKAEELGLDTSNYLCESWSEKDTNTLLELIKTNTIEEISVQLNRSVQSVKRKLRSLGISTNPNKWYVKDLNKLRKMASSHTIDELAETFNRSKNAIQKKLTELNIKCKTNITILDEQDIEVIKNNYSDGFNKEIASKLKISVPRLIKKARELGLKKNNRTWTNDEINNFKKLAETHDINEIAFILELDKYYVMELANKFGIQLKPSIQKITKSNWTPEDVEKLKELWGAIPVYEIVEVLNKSKRAITYKAKSLGLKMYNSVDDDSLRISEIASLVGVSEDKIIITWANLGLIIKSVQINKYFTYRYVNFEDLLSFLFNNQDIWDASKIDEDYLSDLPEWVATKREKDLNNPITNASIKKHTLLKINKNEEN